MGNIGGVLEKKQRIKYKVFIKFPQDAPPLLHRTPDVRDPRE
jgi:hypothetical protein